MIALKSLKLEDPIAEQVRQNTTAAVQEIQQQPAVGMRVVPNVSLTNGVPTLVAHGLSRAPVWIGPSAIRGVGTGLSSTQGIIESFASGTVSGITFDPARYVLLEARGYLSGAIIVDVAVM